MFNQAGAAVSQWDGNEFQGSIAGWDVPHSDATMSSGTGGNYWSMAQHQAAFQSQAMWAQRTAVEGGGGGEPNMGQKLPCLHPQVILMILTACLTCMGLYCLLFS